MFEQKRFDSAESFLDSTLRLDCLATVFGKSNIILAQLRHERSLVLNQRCQCLFQFGMTIFFSAGHIHLT